MLAMPEPSHAGEGDVMLSVDPRQAGAEISPYLYGQFIEHLGRAIKGGIWAEMLHDRKFLLEPGKNWFILSSKNAKVEVIHETSAAYAGAHGLAIHVRKSGGPCGIQQGGLGIVKGRTYTGYAILAHVGKPVPVTLRLSWGRGASAGASVTLTRVGHRYRKFAFRFKAGATTDDARLSVTVAQPSTLWVGVLSLMPADHVRGMRRDTLELIKQLNSPITRWPGGNFVSGYNWKDGIGDRDRRPPRWERAWNAVEDNDFGIDEFMDYCREIGTEPYIAVNTGEGSVMDAVEELEYANGSRSTRWGGERARNGHPKPYGVAWWGIGNEMYGDWQLGHVPVQQYALRHNAFVEAMRAKDSKIRIIAVGSPGKWNDVIVPACANHMELISGHHYTLTHLSVTSSKKDALKYRKNYAEYQADMPNGVRRVADDLRRRVSTGKPEVDRIRLSFDEWGLVRDWNQKPDPPGLGSFEIPYPLGDTISITRALHEILRSADIIAMANWAQTVNVIGLIKTSRTAAVMEGPGHVFALYRAHLLGRVIRPQVPKGMSLDAVASWDAGTRTLAIGLINYSVDQGLKPELKLPAAYRLKQAKGWRVSGDDLLAVNVPGRPEEVTLNSIPVQGLFTEPLDLPPLSVTVLKARLVK